MPIFILQKKLSDMTMRITTKHLEVIKHVKVTEMKHVRLLSDSTTFRALFGSFFREKLPQYPV